MNKYMLLIMPVIVFLYTAMASADIAVIGHDLVVDSLTTKQVRSLFLGKTKKFANGAVAKPVYQQEDSIVKTEFDRMVLRKSAGKMRAFWSKRIFTGKGTPPPSVENDEAVKAWVKKTPGGIGYISGKSVAADDNVLLRQ